MKWTMKIKTSLMTFSQITLHASCKIFLDRVELTSKKPVCQRPRRMSESVKVIKREIRDDLLINGIIRNSFPICQTDSF